MKRITYPVTVHAVDLAGIERPVTQRKKSDDPQEVAAATGRFVSPHDALCRLADSDRRCQQ